jgi:xylan 1,4-beta-xylosidase
MGQVWSIERDAARDSWQRTRRVVNDPALGPVRENRLARGIVSPEIHYLKGKYFITYSMNGQGTGLLKSKTGKPEGPYEDMGRFTGEGTDASLFEDDDGSCYWLVGQGWIAKVKPDFSGLEAQPQLLRCAPFESGKHGKFDMPSPHAPRYLGMAGAHMFKENASTI